MGLRYIDPEKLIKELEEGEFCGYVEFYTKGPDGPERGRILFDSGKIIAASYVIPESGNAFLRDAAMERILRTTKNYVNVYKLDDTDIWLAKDLNTSKLFKYIPKEKITPKDISPEIKEAVKQASIKVSPAASAGTIRPGDVDSSSVDDSTKKTWPKYDLFKYGGRKEPDDGDVPIDRKGLLDKLGLKEPADDFADMVLGEYREYRRSADRTDRTEKKMLEYIKETIKIIAGDEIGDRIIKNQIAELGIDEEYVTSEQIEELIYSLRQNVLRGIFGTDKADEIYNKLREDVASKA